MTAAPDITPLWTRLCTIDLFGMAGTPIPTLPDAIATALRSSAPLLPRAYGAAYIEPVQNGLVRLLGLRDSGQIHPRSAEMILGAILQHAPDFQIAAPLRRFSAVVSDLYRSFLDDAKRDAANIPLRGLLPPLATFQHDGSDGPITIEVDLIDKVIGGKNGVVSLPATVAPHPILWAALAHETGGHDVTHADPGLLDQLAAGLPTALASLPAGGMASEQMAALWTYWMDEASADIYGLLNMGPGFAENLAVFLAAMGGGPAPALRMQCCCDPADPAAALDPHPTDILRLHLALGAIDSLGGLSAATRSAYAARVEALSAMLATGATVTFNGTIADAAGKPLKLAAEIPLPAMQQAARAVGAYIATANLPALGGKTIQALETWDDTDEGTVQTIRDAFMAGRPALGLGDDAQLLAAANLVVIEDAGRYDAVTASLNAALDHSFRTDPIWGLPETDRLYIRY